MKSLRKKDIKMHKVVFLIIKYNTIFRDKKQDDKEIDGGSSFYCCQIAVLFFRSKSDDMPVILTISGTGKKFWEHKNQVLVFAQRKIPNGFIPFGMLFY